MNKKKSIKKNALCNGARTLMNVVFPLITFPYASRILGPAGIGKVDFSVGFVNYFVMIAMLGIDSYGIREAGKLKNDKTGLSKFVKEILFLNLLSTAFSCLVLFGIVFSVPFFVQYRNLMVVCSLAIPFSAIGLNWLFYAMEELWYVVVRNFLFQLLSLFLLFRFVKNPDDYILYAAIGIIQSVGANIFSLLCARKFVNFSAKTRLEIKKHLKPVFIFFLMAISSTVNSSLDVTMLGFFSGDEQVAYYTVAMRIIRIAVSVSTSLTVILPNLSYFFSQNDEESFKNLSTKTLNYNMLLVLPAIMGMAILAERMISFLSGDSFLRSAAVLKILSAGIFFTAISNLAGSHILLAIGKERLTFCIILSGIAFNVLANFFLIRRYGAIGAAVATVLTEAAVMLVEFFYVKKYFSYKIIFANFAQCLVASVFMGAIIRTMNQRFSSSLLSLMACVFSGMALYFLAPLVLKNELVVEVISRRKHA